MSYEALFDHSYERVIAISKGNRGFFEAFYERFLQSSEEIKARFANTDMVAQRRMLKKSFYSLLAFYASGSMDSVLERIGASHGHSGMRIGAALYDTWLECLLDTLAEFDPEFNDEIELAWRLVLSPGITFMKFKSRAPRRP